MSAYTVHALGPRYAVWRDDDHVATFDRQEHALFLVQLLSEE